MASCGKQAAESLLSASISETQLLKSQLFVKIVPALPAWTHTHET
jgi:hypothetical protein